MSNHRTPDLPGPGPVKNRNRAESGYEGLGQLYRSAAKPRSRRHFGPLVSHPGLWPVDHHQKFCLFLAHIAHLVANPGIEMQRVMGI